MSDLVPPILDWIESHAPGRRKRRAPIAPEALRDLEERGAPEALVGLYAAGAHTPGVFPRCSAAETHLLAPERVTRVPGHDSWRFTRPGLDGFALVMHDDGGVQRMHHTPASLYSEPHPELGGEPERWMPRDRIEPLGALLTRHLEALTRGELRFNPHLGCFLYPDERPDLAWAHQLDRRQLAEVHRWVVATRERLGSWESVIVPSLGELSPRSSWSRRPRRPERAPPNRWVALRQESGLQAVLEGRDTLASDDFPGAFITRCLAKGTSVGILGLGLFTVEHRKAHTKVIRAAPGTMEVPAMTYVQLDVWRSLQNVMAPVVRARTQRSRR